MILAPGAVYTGALMPLGMETAESALEKPNIAFIGAGNMARSIVGGLLESGHPASLISAADPFEESLAQLQAIAPVRVGSDNAEAVAKVQMIVGFGAEPFTE